MELRPGMTALTGETGAGKSILLDALGLVLGDRADAGSVKQDAERAEITALFNPPQQSPVWPWLKENDFDDEGNCILRRIVLREGKSRGYINGRPVSMQTLRTAGEMLIDIHGQHEHQSLTKRSTQLALLDSTAKSEKTLQQVAKSYEKLTIVESKLEQLTSESEQINQRIDMLRYQIQEFDALDISDDEVLTIESDYSRMANAGRLLEVGNGILQNLDEGEQSAYWHLTQAQKKLSELAELDGQSEAIVNALEVVNSALINSDEAASSLREYLSSIELDADKLAWLDQRLAGFYRLSKKHKVEIPELAAVANKLKTELAGIDAAGVDAEQLAKEHAALIQVYLDEAAKLSKQRRQTAKLMNERVSKAMNELGMEGGVFDCQVDTDPARITASGQDTVRFLVSPNPGQKPGEINKIASGGELSRISLAVQLLTTSHQSVNAFIFDEVDSGIGGAVAETVGQYLRSLAADAQVLCVTHLPQVAAQAHNHLLVKKKVSRGTTTTSLSELGGEETAKEIARMLGGSKITSKSLQHATEMLQQATAGS